MQQGASFTSKSQDINTLEVSLKLSKKGTNTASEAAFTQNNLKESSQNVRLKLLNAVKY